MPEKKVKQDKREDLVGLKINVDTLIEMNKTINDIKTMFDKYIDNDRYVIGLDETFCAKSHYHLHFKTTSKYDTITDFKSKHFKGQPTTKLYCAKNYTDSDDNVWFAYAIKEDLVAVGNFFQNIDLEPLAKAQREIKKSKFNYNERENYKKSQKVTERDKLFDWLTEHWFRLANKYDCVDERDACLVTEPYKVTYLGQIDYYMLSEGKTIPPKFMLERQSRDYLLFTKKWTVLDLFNFDHRRNI